MEAIIEVAVVEKTPNRRPLRLSKLILVYCYFTVLRQFTLAPVWPDGKNFFQHTAIWNNGNLPNSIKIAKEGAFFCLKLNEVSKNWPKTYSFAKVVEFRQFWSHWKIKYIMLKKFFTFDRNLGEIANYFISTLQLFSSTMLVHFIQHFF